MKYAIIKCVNGNYAIHAEALSLEAAKVSFHQLCAILWNAPDAYTATVCIVDENLVRQAPYFESIVHTQAEEE